MAQVKFYATTAASYSALGEDVDTGGIYFVEGGELYKGTQRFGLGRVTVDAEFNPSTSTKDGQARGDIVVTGTGAGWVFNGTSWISIGGDIGTITSAWKADISTWTAGLAVGDANSYITSISQAADGKVTASAVAFPTLATGTTDGTLKLGSGADAKVSGWDTVKTDISNLQAVVSYSGSGDSVVTATTGSFTNLTVTSTATFSATTVSADTLTIGGKTVNEIAQSEIATSIAALGGTSSSSSNGITVGVTTSGGEVTTVTVNATTFGNVMHFRDTVSNTANVTNPVAGDIVIIAGVTDSESDFVNGQEYIYTTTSTWELIGDQSTYAIKSVVDAALDTKASVGTGTATASYGVSGEVVLSANAQPTLSVAVAPVTTSAGITSTATTSLATAAAIADYVDGKIGALDATVSASENTGVQVQVTQADGVVTGVTADLVWLDANGNVLA